MSNKTSAAVTGQRVTPSTAVMESVQRVQREMEIKNTRNEAEERQWALCKTAAEQAVGQIMARQGLIVQATREDGVNNYDLGLASTNQMVSTGHYPLQFQAQNVITTAAAPAGILVQEHSQNANIYMGSNTIIPQDIIPINSSNSSLHAERGIACSTILALLELIIIFLFGVFVNYENGVTARPVLDNTSAYRRQLYEEDSSGLHHFYPCKS